MFGKATALERATPTVQAEAMALARSRASKAAKLAKETGVKIVKMKAIGLGALGAGMLGGAELMGVDASLGPVDAGLTIGIPTVIAGALASIWWPGFGDGVMMFGNGPLCAGIRSQIASLKKISATAGEYDGVAGEYDSVR